MKAKWIAAVKVHVESRRADLPLLFYQQGMAVRADGVVGKCAREFRVVHESVIENVYALKRILSPWKGQKRTSRTTKVTHIENVIEAS